LSKTAPALQHIAAEVSVNNIPAQGTHSQADATSTDGGPAWGHLSKAWESIRDSSDDGKKLLPMDFSQSASDSHAFPRKGLQRVLSYQVHARNFDTLYAQAPDKVAAAMYSLKSQHALTWRRICPFEPSLQIRSIFCQMRIRQELSLPMPNLKLAHQRKITTTCCAKHHPALEPHHAFDHLMCTAKGNAGGSMYTTHNAVRDTVEKILRRAIPKPTSSRPRRRSKTASTRRLRSERTRNSSHS
jgi:hypothetical protein